MRLNKVQITEFQSVRDSTEFDINDITCLVGKNEAGKTSLLKALYRLNPIEASKNKYSVVDDYPRWDVEDYQEDVESGRINPARVVKAWYELGTEDIELVEENYGTDALKSTTLTLEKGYNNERTFSLQVDEIAALKHLRKQHEFTPELSKLLDESSSISDTLDILDKAESTSAVLSLKEQLEPLVKNGVAHHLFNKLLISRVPKFLYFDEYYQMRGHDNIEALMARKKDEQLQEPDHPLLGLISLARLDLETLLNPGRTQLLKNKLEGAGNHLTKQIVKYWSQNKHLQMRFDVRPAQPNDPEHMRSGTNIWAEVYDTKRWVSTGLSTLVTS